MRRAAAVVLVVALILAVVAPPAQACVECVALGLASFAVFTQFVSALTTPRVVYAAPAYYPAYYSGYYPGYSAGYGYPVAYASAAPYGAYYPTGYYPAYRPTYAVAATPVAWNGSRVVQYAHGRYELRGDGLNVPYAWVWIPNAPPPVPSYDGPEGAGARTP
jgi:hypothetical protein